VKVVSRPFGSVTVSGFGRPARPVADLDRELARHAERHQAIVGIELRLRPVVVEEVDGVVGVDRDEATLERARGVGEAVVAGDEDRRRSERALDDEAGERVARRHPDIQALELPLEAVAPAAAHRADGGAAARVVALPAEAAAEVHVHGGELECAARQVDRIAEEPGG
jgi:hypothetical protein